jgi:hypothetical protein
MRGTITTIACLPSAIAFNAVVPVLSEDDRIFRCVDRGAIHLLFGHGIKLLEFRGLPIIPVGELSKHAAGETAKALFLGRAMRRRVFEQSRSWTWSSSGASLSALSES